ncbi:phosphotransferase [Pontibacillus salicampi]|uniref:Phosphotransferase n=1 Tax=Pontibacillus salicampi TaxID=1449801 RepID=A0ABV6LJE4_9BACI
MIPTNKREGDVVPDIPFSLFHLQGGLIIHQRAQINQRVWKLNTSHGPFITKVYTSIMPVKQQWYFFRAQSIPEIVPFISFPTYRESLYDADGYIWVLMPFVEGNRLHFSNSVHRHAAEQSLQFFHEKAKKIDVPDLIQRPTLLLKWKRRVLDFELTERYFIQEGKREMYQEIIQYAKEKLIKLQEVVNPFMSADNISWNHGDVASHNFMITRHNDIKLIDFDLLHRGPVVHDQLQLGHRFIAGGSSADEISKMLLFQPVYRSEWFYHGLSFPAWIIREWNHFLLKEPTSEERAKRIRLLEYQWHIHQSFVANYKHVLT